MQDTLARYEIVLLGLGHTHAHILRMWRMRPVPETRLTCVSDFPVATYSGMLPAVLAGQYPVERMQIDLVRLCAAAKARLILAEVTGLDQSLRQLHFRDHPTIPYDLLSIGVGSVPRLAEGISTEFPLIPIKPMQTFLDRLGNGLARVPAAKPLEIVLVGAGAGGIEIACCLPAYLERQGRSLARLHVVDAGPELGKGLTAATVQRLDRLLRQRGVDRHLGQRVQEVDPTGVTLADGRHIAADLVVWSTGAAAPPLLDHLGLPRDDRGFLRIEPTLQVVGESRIFAVGDTATLTTDPTPKAGVYAVRQGPILWQNLRRFLEQRPLKSFQPQQRFLKLLNTGDGQAIAEWYGWSFQGHWCWRWKDRIDGRFMDKYQDYRPMRMSPTTTPPAVMRCAGCGGKIAGSVLDRVFARLKIPTSEHVVLGLEQADDAAIIRPPGGRPITATVDFFAAPLPDPYLVGRLAALNALSDIQAMAACPLAALALITLPVGPAHRQEELLYELLSGSLEELAAVGATLVGGHTIEGPRLTAGFTILGDQGSEPPHTKSGLQPGDRLILTRPLGTGILLAAHMQARCRANWLMPMLDRMLHGNAGILAQAIRPSIHAMTDVTGFGLAGHLLEMLRASRMTAELHVDQIPLFAGVTELLNAGIESTLTSANRQVEVAIQVAQSLRQAAEYRALFDPQTCGGILLGVSETKVSSLLEHLHAQGHRDAVVIGQITSAAVHSNQIMLVIA